MLAQEIISALSLVATKANGEIRNFSPLQGQQLYWTHLHTVVQFLILQGLTERDILLAGALHDIVEDSDFTLAEVEVQFGKRVAQIVDLTTKPKDYSNANPQSAETYFGRFWEALEVDRDLGLAAMQVKVADRLTNLIEITYIADEARKQRYLTETTKWFIPLAKEIGWLKQLESSIHFLQTNLQD
jgi:GTP pyrophosphokinase